MIPVMGMEEQGRALLEGATLTHHKKDRERAHKFVNHQCRWLDDATYRMTASGMGKTFHCDVAWCVDPWKADAPEALVPPEGHPNAGQTGIPTGCPMANVIPDVGQYDGSGKVKAR